MIVLLQKIHSFFYRKNKIGRYRETNKLMWLIANVITHSISYVIYFAILIRYWFRNMPEALDENNALILSLTSFPKRIKNVWMVVDLLMRQSLKPRGIYLYLSKLDFPEQERQLPEKLLKYTSLGLHIVFVDDNLKPHKKYFYAFQYFQDDCIITVDDDAFYRNDMIEKLWLMHKKYPNAICANNARNLIIDKKGNFKSYIYWEEVIARQSPSHLIIAIGFGGILYPPSFYYNNKSVVDVNLLKKTSFYADDLWLKANEVIANCKIVVDDYYSPPAGIPSTRSSALTLINIHDEEPLNDVQWNNLLKCFDLNNKF